MGFHFTLAVIHDFALYCLIIPIKNGIINASKNFMCARVCFILKSLFRSLVAVSLGALHVLKLEALVTMLDTFPFSGRPWFGIYFDFC